MCTTAEQLQQLCRDDDNSPEILREHADEVLGWLEGHREWLPMHEARANGLIFAVFGITHLTERPRPVYVVQTPTGPRVDIGAFLAWSSEDWNNLVTGRATSASIVRASVSRISYYNYRFNDESVYQSYRLDPHGDEPSLWGYALRGSATATALERLVADRQTFPLVLTLDEGERGSNHRQFHIARVLAAGWVMGPELVEDNLPQISGGPPIFVPSTPKEEESLPAKSRNSVK